MDITGYVCVFNHSGEEYENAQVRLVAGKINLVEKIAALARRQYGVSVDRLAGKVVRQLKKEAVQEAMMEDSADFFGRLAPAEAKEIAKEGLGDYFIYTIPGTETIPDGWSKQMLSFEGNNAEFKIQYRYRPAEYGNQMVRMFVLTNNKESHLGDTPLPDGIVRVYRDNGQNGLSFRVQQQIKYVPIGDEIELNLGPDPEVIHEWVKLKSWRENFWFKRRGVDVRRNLSGRHQIEIKDTLDGWEDHARYVERIR